MFSYVRSTESWKWRLVTFPVMWSMQQEPLCLCNRVTKEQDSIDSTRNTRKFLPWMINWFTIQEDSKWIFSWRCWRETSLGWETKSPRPRINGNSWRTSCHLKNSVCFQTRISYLYIPTDYSHSFLIISYWEYLSPWIRDPILSLIDLFSIQIVDPIEDPNNLEEVKKDQYNLWN